MTEQELRVLVRQAVAFHIGGRPGHTERDHAVQAHAASDVAATLYRQHTSHTMFTLPTEPGDACVIEPAVSCTHCGFCKSYGH